MNPISRLPDHMSLLKILYHFQHLQEKSHLDDIARKSYQDKIPTYLPKLRSLYSHTLTPHLRLARVSKDRKSFYTRLPLFTLLPQSGKVSFPFYSSIQTSLQPALHESTETDIAFLSN